MGDMTRCPKCATFHYRNDPCPDDDKPAKTKMYELDCNHSPHLAGLIPRAILTAINHYVWYGYEPGGFVCAVLCNDLLGAMGRADPNSREDMHAICTYVHDAVPSCLIGSGEAYKAHIANARMFYEEVSQKQN